MRVSVVAIVVVTGIACTGFNVDAADPPSAVGAMLNLLKSGRVPEQRLGTIVKLVCSRGNEHDLAYVFSEALPDDHWPDDLRRDALQWLIDAARTRKVVPAGELSGLQRLLSSPNTDLQEAAITLAGLWRVGDLYDPLQEMTHHESLSNTRKSSILTSMAAIDPDRTKNVLSEMTSSEHAFATRALAVAISASLDPDQAADIAAEILSQASDRDDPAPILDAFLDLQGGSRRLAESVRQHPPAADVALLTLRHIYSVGRSDPELNAVLSEIAGISGDPEPLTKEEVLELAQVVAETGDPVRGEQVFRRNDLSCMKCHAVSKAGGQIGPDLSAVGASSPVDYVITSVLDPDQAIKEAYITRIVLTLEGRIHQGIVADRTADALVLKDATGKRTSIAIDDIDDEVEGKSLMPKGLVKFMTEAEFIDLAKFLSMLGKPGPYAIRTTQRMQRWRVLQAAPDALIREVPPLSTFEDLVLRSPNWLPAYSKVNGELPIDELATLTNQDVVYLLGEVQVSQSGSVEFQIDFTGAATDATSFPEFSAWVDDHEIGRQTNFELELESGTHRVVLRLPVHAGLDSVKLELQRSPGSKAAFTVVDGQ